jgi:hypothetical protein
VKGACNGFSHALFSSRACLDGTWGRVIPWCRALPAPAPPKRDGWGVLQSPGAPSRISHDGFGRAGLQSLCENSWIHAFAAMTGRNTAPKSSAATPAEAGGQPGQCQTPIFTQTLQPSRFRAFLIISAPCAPRSPAPAELRGMQGKQRSGAAIWAGLKPALPAVPQVRPSVMRNPG